MEIQNDLNLSSINSYNSNKAKLRYHIELELFAICIRNICHMRFYQSSKNSLDLFLD